MILYNFQSYIYTFIYLYKYHLREKEIKVLSLILFNLTFYDTLTLLTGINLRFKENKWGNIKSQKGKA